MKTLYLLRHAKAESGGGEINDPDRKLSGRGREAAAVMGAYMKIKGYKPALMLSSPSARTRETLELVAGSAGMKAESRFIKNLYLASAEEIIEAVQGADKDISSVMVVGHNPGMHHASLLLSEPKRTKLRAALELKFPTCALAVLRFEQSGWEAVGPGMGMLADFATPGELENS